jgi:hypothetical protein
LNDSGCTLDDRRVELDWYVCNLKERGGREVS